jgi:hypothetical protein
MAIALSALQGIPIRYRRHVMKFESHILAGLFVLCFVVCTLVMGAMLKITPTSVQLANANTVAATLVR